MPPGREVIIKAHGLCTSWERGFANREEKRRKSS
jgi:hypothetical protein